jgi:SAM-dependent methyltransferase
VGEAPGDASILDAACGAGRVLACLARTGRPVVGCDLSAAMLEEARSAGTPLLRGSAFRLPFAEDAFDTVVAVRLLHHFEAGGRRSILAELARVARRRVVATAFDADSIKHRRRLRKAARRGRPSGRLAVRREDFLEELREAGLRVDRLVSPLPGYADLLIASGEIVGEGERA